MARDDTTYAKDVSLDTLIQRAKDLVPALAERTAEAEQLRQLPEKTVEDLHNSGLLKFYQPKRYGGLEMCWGAHAYTANELARGCGSTAWIQCVVGSHTWLASRFPIEAQDEIYDDPNVLIASAFAGGRGVKLEEVSGGFRLSGEWSFASGIPHAQWITLGAQRPSDRNGKYEMTLFAVPRSDFKIVDNWNAQGLRGTGSHNVRVDDIYIPSHRAIGLASYFEGNTDGAKSHDGYIYRVAMPPYFSTVVLGPILGTAKGAMEAYLNITKDRVGAMFGETIREQVPVQTRIAESAAEINAAGLVLWRILDELHEFGVNGETVPKGAQVRHKRDGVFYGRLCENAVDRLVSMMGASGLYDSNPVHRYFRDIRAMTAHFSQQWDIGMAPFGCWALGIETGNESIDNAPDGVADLF